MIKFLSFFFTQLNCNKKLTKVGKFTQLSRYIFTTLSSKQIMGVFVNKNKKNHVILQNVIKILGYFFTQLNGKKKLTKLGKLTQLSRYIFTTFSSKQIMGVFVKKKSCNIMIKFLRFFLHKSDVKKKTKFGHFTQI